MDELIKTVRQNKTSIVIALAIVMFVAFGFCPAIDVAGKAKINGLKVLFEGSGLGFSRFLSVLIFLAPMFVVLNNSVNLKLTGKLSEHFCTLCFMAGVVLCLLFAIALPSGISLLGQLALYAHITARHRRMPHRYIH